MMASSAVSFTESDDEVIGASEDEVAGAIGLSMGQAYNGPVRHRLPFSHELVVARGRPPGTFQGES